MGKETRISKEKSNVMVCFAPSWGPQNLLRMQGPELIRNILALGYAVTIRPHPLSFVFDQDIIEEVINIERESADCVIETKSPSLNSLLEADVLVSDWSGVAFEFAFGLCRPVLFIQTPRKAGDAWKEFIELPALEDQSRSEIGIVTNSANIERDLENLLANKEYWREKIEVAREEHLFNFGRSIEATVKLIEQISERPA